MVFPIPTRLELNICRGYFAWFRNSLFWKHILQNKWSDENHICIVFFSHTLYLRTQKTILFPAINFVYKQCWQSILKCVQNSKYVIYSLMNAHNNEMIDCHVVYVAVEILSKWKKGFMYIAIKVWNYGAFHQVFCYRKTHADKFLHEKEQPDITYQFDIWHVGKSIKTDLFWASKLKFCEELKPWIRAIMNHFWWSCRWCNGDVLKLK